MATAVERKKKTTKNKGKLKQVLNTLQVWMDVKIYIKKKYSLKRNEMLFITH